jgi:hypothetical protein
VQVVEALYWFLVPSASLVHIHKEAPSYSLEQDYPGAGVRH